MSIIIGSARHDENGRYANGAAGDQDGTEVSTQPFYQHSKGWYVIRPKMDATAKKIAYCMKWACDNNHIGYDQNQRNTLYEKAKLYDFDVRGVQVNVETDCSALVRVCCRYAGISVGDFTTSNEVDVLENTGHFQPAFKYTTGAALYEGDILCTCSKGHTVVVVSGTDRGKYELGWHGDGSGWWYAKSETEYAKSEWMKINKHWYYFNASGYAVKGHNTINGKEYYFCESGDLECAMMRTNMDGSLYIKDE